MRLEGDQVEPIDTTRIYRVHKTRKCVKCGGRGFIYDKNGKIITCPKCGGLGYKIIIEYTPLDMEKVEEWIRKRKKKT